MTKRTKAQKLAEILDVAAVEVTAGKARRHYLPDHGAGDPRGLFQRYPGFYALIHDIVTPTLALDSWREFLPDPDVGVVVNLGSGCRRLHPEMINVDMVAFPTVDLVADFQSPLPIRSGSVDAVVSIAVLEHLADPLGHIDEIARILKPAGIVYAAVPFLYPFHEAPQDYWRWTAEGLNLAFGRCFQQVRVGSRGGVAGPLILLLSHFVAQLLCFGSHRAYSVANVMAMTLLSPLKLLDLLFGRLPFCMTFCANLFFVGRRI